MRILTISNNESTLALLDTTLRGLGYSHVSASSRHGALNVLASEPIRVVIMDWSAPSIGCIELCRRIRQSDVSGYIYVIMATSHGRQRIEGLCAGADDFISQSIQAEELLACLKTAERVLALETRDVALFAMAKLVESRDPVIGAHIERLQSYARVIAQHLSEPVAAYHGVDAEYVRLLGQTIPLHDLGNVGLPDSVMLKPGPLTTDERAVMKTHTTVGAYTLETALRRFPSAKFLKMAKDIVLSHHERYDGSGYPHGLVGEEIPLSARIVALVDVYDAVTSRRVYKQAKSHEEAREFIVRERGKQFDPEVVDAFCRSEELMLAIRDELGEEAVERGTLNASGAAASSSAASERDKARGRGRGILIVDDEAHLREKVASILEATGEQVLIARDGAEAQRLVAEHHPAVVVSDWVMPACDGLELCRSLRSDPAAGPLHFIMMTAHSERERLLEAYAAGVDDFVAKPFDGEELLARVRAGIRAARLLEELTHNVSDSRAATAKLVMLNSQLEKLSVTDELTGLFNRRHAMECLREQWKLAERYNKPLSVAALDVDHFKRINDTYGHDNGDVVLKKVSSVLQAQARETDVVCRVGGEEFLVLFPEETSEEAAVYAERCRAAIEQLSFVAGEAIIKVTISAGVATRSPEMHQCLELVKKSDELLYQAKRSGRNQVAMAVSQGVEREKASDAHALNHASDAPIDLDKVLQRCGGDAAFANAVVERFQAQAGPLIQQLEMAYRSNDTTTVERLGHTLKSMAAYLGAEPLVETARCFENARTRSSSELDARMKSLRMQAEQLLRWLEGQPPYKLERKSA